MTRFPRGELPTPNHRCGLRFTAPVLGRRSTDWVTHFNNGSGCRESFASAVFLAEGIVALHAPWSLDYEDASRPMLPGGGSVPWTPPSVTCSVHSDPDQYRAHVGPMGRSANRQRSR